jgi:hypothetical protein
MIPRDGPNRSQNPPYLNSILTVEPGSGPRKKVCPEREDAEMKAFKTLLVVGLALGLSGCVQPDASRSGQPGTMSLATKNAPKAGAVEVAKKVAIPLNVTDVVIKVPTSLRVSEADTWYPLADVVWRGEPRANRLVQVQAIFEEAAARGTSDLKSGVAVVAEVEVVRFHCVTEKTRNTIGGMHSMFFNLTIRDAATGAVLDGPRLVNAETKASGGSKAISEDYAGRTQRVVVVERLAQVLHDELDTLLADPTGFGLTLSSSGTEPGKLVLSAMNAAPASPDLN